MSFGLDNVKREPWDSRPAIFGCRDTADGAFETTPGAGFPTTLSKDVAHPWTC
jgi:hypothetical protein